MRNGLQELAAGNILQKQQIRSTLPVFSEIIYSCTGGISQTREEG